jgi:hypothetical protein
MGRLRRTRSLPPLVLGGIALSTLLVATLRLFIDSHTTIERHKGRIPQEVYVWQRQWNPTLSKALEQAAAQASGFSVLAAEVSWRAGQVDRVFYAPIDYSTLKATRKPVSLVLRIGPYSGPFDKSNGATTLVTRLAASLVTDARSVGIEPKELQIDFDCAESKLSGYCEWVRAVCEKIHPVPVAVTVLPCWLRQKAFLDLVRTADAFVLQVHSLERPTGPEAPITLCDCAATLQWVERAAQAGIPFRVALPTYGYLVAFDKEGRFVGLGAEGPSQAWPGDVILRIVRSDPVAIAQLMRKWQPDRPQCMQGVIWYRLPVESDRLNWRWATLSALMDGQIPRKTLQVEVEYPQPELAEVVLINDGAVDLSAAVRIGVECDRKEIVAADGLSGFAIVEMKPSRISLVHDGTTVSPIIRAGERWKVAWIRFKSRIEGTPHVSLAQP